MSFVEDYLNETKLIAEQINRENLDKAAELLAEVRNRGGRLFVLGVGGSAATASHAVNDFRKIAGMEAYAPTDNVAELTARTNDDGWTSVFEAWLQGSHLRAEDAVLVFSVGGGSIEKNVSPVLVAGLMYAQKVGAPIIGVVGRNGGFTREVAEVCILVPIVNLQHITPHTEEFHAVVSHLLVSHPKLKVGQTKWEMVR